MITQAQLDVAMRHIYQSLRPMVIRIRCKFGEDHDGDDCIRARIVMADESVLENVITENTRRVTDAITDALWSMGIQEFCYTSFRSQSEVDARSDPDWD